MRRITPLTEGLGVDIYVLSLYKLFGLHLGLMYVKEQHHKKLDNQSLEFMPELYSGISSSGAPNYLRIALNPGLVNHEEVTSLLGLVEYLQTLHFHHFEKNAVDFHHCIKSHQISFKNLSYCNSKVNTNSFNRFPFLADSFCYFFHFTIFQPIDSFCMFSRQFRIMSNHNYGFAFPIQIL